MNIVISHFHVKYGQNQNNYLLIDNAKYYYEEYLSTAFQQKCSQGGLQRKPTYGMPILTFHAVLYPEWENVLLEVSPW